MEHIEKYREIQSKYDSFTIKLDNLVKDILEFNKIEYHIVERRTKSVESFTQKIRRKNEKYIDPIKEITDLSGIRIILYYQDEIKNVEKLLKKEFDIQWNKSIIKGDELNPNEFGYMSNHYIINLTPSRKKLVEWKTYSDFQAEIQVRTVLQHSWASISHALQYKTQQETPRSLQRKLFRLAGLFELADEEFLSIREKHILLSNKVALISNIEDSNSKINLLTIKKYIAESDTIKRMFKLAIKSGFLHDVELGKDDKVKGDKYADIIEMCNSAGIKTIKELHRIVSGTSNKSQNYFKKLIAEDAKNESVGWYIGNDFVTELILILANSEKFTSKFLKQLGWSESIANRVIKVAKEIESLSLKKK